MLSYKSWCILWVTVAIVPLGVVVQMSGLDLNWVMLNGFILTLPCFPVVLSIFWSKTTRHGVIAGAVCGLLGGVGALLGAASTYPGGLQPFLKNTSENVSVMAGAGTSIGVSFVVCFVVSLLTHKIRTDSDVENEWRKLRDIDNPLHPWSELYTEDIPDLAVGERPSVKRLEQAFGRARIAAYVGGLATVVLCAGVVPGVMISLHVLTETQFTVWTHVLQWFCFSMAAVVVVVAPVEEVIQVVRRVRANNRERCREEAAKYAYSQRTINNAD
ncbi:hypothetical protein DPMN_115498 [Dreissena polymorpha]|uniref:Uncharacterized protein n=2 Tax=Dreissena polymorpha TaxID=45954 RepID=A0A9D4QTT7_DREPO|nr:hypothetical protein DPMN_115498 [Dreissena polymorpha]